MTILSSLGNIITSNGVVLINKVVIPPLPNFALDGYKPGTNTDNIVLQLGAGGSWDDNKILHPCAIERSGVVYLFYTGYDGANWAIGVSSVSSSSFNGLNLSKYGSNPILSAGTGGAWDDGGVFDPWVIYDADTSLWKMWFRGYDGSSLHKIGYATASDPLGPWTKYGSNPVLSNGVAWEGNLVILPNVLRRSSSDYVMLYTGNEPASTNGRIGLATSSDGISWTKEASNPVLDPDTGWMDVSVFSPRTLVLDGSTYKLYFSGKETSVGYSASGLATSSDLITWSLDSDNPLLTSTRTWEGAGSGEVENPNAIHVGTNWYIYYDAWFGSPSTIGVAIVPD